MKTFDYERPESLPQAIKRIGARSRPLAGGTDLLTLMKADLETPERLVDVRALLPAGIEERADGLWIGAGSTLSEVESNSFLKENFTALTDAARVAASPQIRNMATLGGNLLQRPRCWYYRNPRIRCWLKGGADCPAREGENRLHGLFGGGPCHAVHPSDIAPALAAFDADVRLAGPGGERWLALERFFVPPTEARRGETAIGEEELLLGVRLPPHPEGTRSAYLKAMDRGGWAFALAGAAVALRLSGRTIAHARVVLAGVAPVPWRVQSAERVLAGAPVSAETFEKAARAALQGASPLRHNGYKMPLARALLRRALQSAAQ